MWSPGSGSIAVGLHGCHLCYDPWGVHGRGVRYHPGCPYPRGAMVPPTPSPLGTIIPRGATQPTVFSSALVSSRFPLRHWLMAGGWSVDMTSPRCGPLSLRSSRAWIYVVASAGSFLFSDASSWCSRVAPSRGHPKPRVPGCRRCALLR